MTNGFWGWFNTEAKPKLGERAETYTKMFEYLDTFNRPVTIIETGCMRSEDNWAGDGCSTILFDKYVGLNGGFVYSVDIDPTATAIAKSLSSDRTMVHTGDSIAHLKWLAGTHAVSPDLLYLDAYDLDQSRPLASQIHHFKELEAALPMIRSDTLVVVDDSPAQISDGGMITPTGKGALVSQYANEVGAVNKFIRWQAGWVNMQGPVVPARSYKQLDDELRSLVERARKHYEDKEDIQAGNLYSLVIALTPESIENWTGLMRVAHGEACVFFARLSLANNRIGTAYDWYKRAITADPRAVEYRLEMASKIYRGLKFWQAGRAEAHACTLIEPDNSFAWGILGGFEQDLGNINNTVFCYDKEIELDPKHENGLLDRVSIALDLEEWDKVSELAEKIAKTKFSADADHCLAMMAFRQGRHEEAIEYYDKALAGDVLNRASVHWNKSLALHSLGKYKEGWQEHAWREHDKIQSALSMPMKRFKLPLWNKEPPPAKIHVHMEAGAGDNICCSRYLRILHERGYEVTYECYHDMVSIMKRSFPEINVIPQASDYPGALGVPGFDYHLPIGELPHKFETDIDTVPLIGVYIKTDQDLVAKYKSLLPIGIRKIGLCWSSGIREGIWVERYGKKKSMPFSHLQHVFTRSDHHFVSLQVGPERKDRWGRVVDILPDQPSWDDTAALVENLDLVITVDTAVAHLAGAMGKETWLMMHSEGSWHWMAGRPGFKWNTKSPWYPSVRIFRQNKHDDWSDVIKSIECRLK